MITEVSVRGSLTSMDYECDSFGNYSNSTGSLAWPIENFYIWLKIRNLIKYDKGFILLILLKCEF